MSKMKGKRLSLSSFWFLLLTFLVYSTTGIFSKLASMQQMMSISYFQYFAFVIIAMVVYAVLWQIILKRVALSQAYLFKSVAVIFSLLFAWSIFHEAITVKNIIGCGFIIAGIVLNSYRQTA